MNFNDCVLFSKLKVKTNNQENVIVNFVAVAIVLGHSLNKRGYIWLV